MGGGAFGGRRVVGWRGRCCGGGSHAVGDLVVGGLSLLFFLFFEEVNPP